MQYKKTTPATGVIYARVSSLDQLEGTSLESQERLCREYAVAQGIRVLETFVERGESAKSANRTELNRAMMFCRRQRVGHFIVYKLDRFARNQDDHVMVRTYLRRSGTELRSVTEPIDDTPVGRAMEGMLSVFAEFDNNVRTERSKQGMVERVRQGIWMWSAPVGYLREHEKANLTPDPRVAPLIRLAFEEFATGRHTYSSIAKLLSSRGFRSRHGIAPTESRIHKILTNPVYAGIIRAWGEDFEGGFPPIVSQRLFDACQRRKLQPLAPHASPRSLHNPQFPLRGFVTCSECGMPLTGSNSRGSKGTRYPYYHHTRRECSLARWIRKEQLEQHFCDFLGCFTISSDMAEALRAILKETWDEAMACGREQEAVAKKEITVLEGERQRVFELHRSGTYSDDDFREQKRLIDERIQQKRLSLLDRSSSEIKLVEKALEDCVVHLVNPTATWVRLEADFTKRLHFQKLLVPTGVWFDGQGVRTQSFSFIYRLKRSIETADSDLVTFVTNSWGTIAAELQGWEYLQ